MRKGLIISTALFAVVALSSCTSITDNAYTTVPETMVVNMTVADIDVAKDHVTATSTWNWNPFRTIKDHKKNAEAIALRESGADVLIEPSYEVTKRGIFRGGSVTVSGYPGRFVNFRNMTEKDAEVINTLKGNLGVGTPMIKTTGPNFIDRLKPKKAPKAPKAPKPASETEPGQFVSLNLGGVSGEYIKDGFSLGLMYGNYGKKWGWYGKIMWDTCKLDEWREEGATNGFSLTAGAIKTLPKHFNLFFGTGVGTSLGAHRGRFALPIEVGAQWNYKKFNISFGLQNAINICEPDQYNNFKYTFGFGYNF